jgi:predicted DNA-binding transcriptional regulator YafY
MNRKNLSSRLHELERYLLTKPRTQKEITEHFGVDRKTVRRAIDKLSQTASIYEEKDGRNIVYSILECNLNTGDFTPMEIAALVLSGETISAGGSLSFGSPFSAAGKSLIQKVRKQLPPRIKQNLDEMTNILGTAAIPNKDYSEFGAVIEELTTAAVERRTISMIYAGLSSREREERFFDPYNIYLDPDGATLKTIGYDHKNQRTGVFSLDRIRKLNITREKFTRPKNFSLRKFLEDNCFNGIHNPPVTVHLRVFGTTARIFRERKFHPTQKTLLYKKTKGSEEIEIEMTVASGRGLERFVLSWLPEIEVLAPESLRLDIERIIAKSRR